MNQVRESPPIATATNPQSATTSSWVKGDQVVEFVGIGWVGYQGLLRVQGERSRPQITYLEGDALLVSPSLQHEWMSNRLGPFVMEVVVGLDIPCVAIGQTTLHRRRKRGGVQPDASFYFANSAAIAAKKGKEDIDLRVDPPPDLAIEVVHTHKAEKAIKVLESFSVPEVWVCDEASLRILVLGEDRRYREADRSVALPFLTGEEIHSWVIRDDCDTMTDWCRTLRQWVETVLVPRTQAG